MSKTLLVVDVQKGFVTPSSNHIVEPIRRLQSRFENVAFAKFYNPESSPFRRFLDYHALSPNTAVAELAIEPCTNAFVFERPHYSAITPDVLAQLSRWAVEEVYLCGIATEACVLATALDLFEEGIRPVVIRDLCASDRDSHFHDAAMELIEKLIGAKQLVSVREIT